MPIKNHCGEVVHTTINVQMKEEGIESIAGLVMP